MKKVLFVMLSLYNGGAEKSLVNLLNELPEDKYEVDLLLFRPEGLFLNQVPAYVNILEIPETLKRLFGPINKSGKYMIPKVVSTFFAALAEKKYKWRRAYRWNHCYTNLIEPLEKQYDVAVGYTSNEVLYFLNEKVNASRKLVWIHNDYIAAGHPPAYDYPHLCKMGGIVTISETCKQILDDLFPDLKERIYNIPNITSSQVVRRRADAFVPEEYGAEDYNILSIGRLSEQKGFDFAIQAAAILKQRGRQFSWFIIGDGPLEKQLREQIDALDVTDRVHLIGIRENPYPYIRNCSLLAQTSRYEGKSVVLDETKILGVPILATDYPTVRDQILDGMEGMIVPMAAEGIADGIEKMMQNPAIGGEIRTYLADHEYGNQAEVQKYMKLIDGELSS